MSNPTPEGAGSTTRYPGYTLRNSSHCSHRRHITNRSSRRGTVRAGHPPHSASASRRESVLSGAPVRRDDGSTLDRNGDRERCQRRVAAPHAAARTGRAKTMTRQTTSIPGHWPLVLAIAIPLMAARPAPAQPAANPGRHEEGAADHRGSIVRLPQEHRRLFRGLEAGGEPGEYHRRRPIHRPGLGPGGLRERDSGRGSDRAPSPDRRPLQLWTDERRADLARLLDGARRLAAADALVALEGPNEPNNWGITYQGQAGGRNLSWLPVAKLQRDLYRAVKSDPVLKTYPVWSITEGGAETDDVGLQFLTIPAGAAR